MADSAPSPFDSIESTQEFIALLETAILDSIREIESEVVRATEEHQGRRVDALNLALYKLGQLKGHVGKSRRIVNDLRSIRRLLTPEN